MYMKGKELKNTGKLVELKDGNHKLTIDYNTLSDLEEIYGTVSAALDVFSGQVKSKVIKNYLTAAINSCIENEEDHYSSFEIGKLMDTRKNQYYVNVISKLLIEAMPEEKAAEEVEDDEEAKN